MCPPRWGQRPTPASTRSPRGRPLDGPGPGCRIPASCPLVRSVPAPDLRTCGPRIPLRTLLPGAGAGSRGAGGPQPPAAIPRPPPRRLPSAPALRLRRPASPHFGPGRPLRVASRPLGPLLPSCQLASRPFPCPPLTTPRPPASPRLPSPHLAPAARVTPLSSLHPPSAPLWPPASPPLTSAPPQPARPASGPAPKSPRFPRRPRAPEAASSPLRFGMNFLSFPQETVTALGDASTPSFSGLHFPSYWPFPSGVNLSPRPQRASGLAGKIPAALSLGHRVMEGGKPGNSTPYFSPASCLTVRGKNGGTLKKWQSGELPGIAHFALKHWWALE
nr:uncharacterized protein LOC129058224 [Pongo abelii]